MIDRSNTDITARIHPEAELHGDCRVGARTAVWQFASVIRSSVLGEDCRIATCAIVDASLLGDRVIVSHGAFVDPGMAIGDDVFIGPHVAFCNDFWPRVSKGGWFDIAKLISREIIVTAVEDGASIGAGAIILPGLTIGARSMVAAGAVVSKSVPPDFLWMRDGSMTPIDLKRTPNRMRSAE